jgi:hypothetical protein
MALPGPNNNAIVTRRTSYPPSSPTHAMRPTEAYGERKAQRSA